MTIQPLELTLLAPSFAICRLPADAGVPEWARSEVLLSLTRTQGELSVVCDEHAVPTGIACQRGWRCLEVRGPLDWALVGVLVRLLQPLAAAGISVFTLSTYDTDYVLVQEASLGPAIGVLRRAHFVIRE